MLPFVLWLSGITFIVLLVWLDAHEAAASTKMDRARREAWWAAHRNQERLSKLQLAWRAGFRRDDDEPEDAFIARFEAWCEECRAAQYEDDEGDEDDYEYDDCS